MFCSVKWSRDTLINFIPILVLVFVSFGVAFWSPVELTGSDSRGSLLTAQAILEGHGLDIGPYGSEVVESLTYRAFWKENKAYYFYPVGSSLVSLPFVAVANFLGMDMVNVQDDRVMQRFLGALAFAVSSVLLLIISSYYLSGIWIWIITIIIVFGSSIASTLATVYWNMDPLFVIQLLVFLHIIQFEKRKIEGLNPYYVGFLLTLAFLCRPTAALFIVFVFLYFFAKNRKKVLQLAFSSLIFLAIYSAHTVAEYGTFLPDCYFQSVGAERSLWEGVKGVLISPGRGVFVYSPILIATFCGLVFYFRYIFNHFLSLLCLGWFVIHVLLISSWGMWWGGWCYGPRLLTDCFVGVAYLSILVFSRGLCEKPIALRNLWKVSILSFGFISIFINTIQGMYNPYTSKWFTYPDPDSNYGILFDWSYPYFLANKWQDEDRQLYVYERYLDERDVYVSSSLSGDVEIDLLYGWSGVEGEPSRMFVWSSGKKSVFRLRSTAVGNPLSRVSRIRMEMGAFKQQTGWIQVVGGSRISFEVDEGSPVQDYWISLEGFEDRADSVIVEILFDAPKRPSDYFASEDTRELGFSLNSVSVEFK